MSLLTKSKKKKENPREKIFVPKLLLFELKLDLKIIVRCLSQLDTKLKFLVERMRKLMFKNISSL